MAEEIRLLIADILKQDGYCVVVPVDSYVALEQALDGAYDLIILDDQMPLIDGRAFIETLEAYGARPSILFLSNSHDNWDPQAICGLGVKDLILKPFRVDHLRESVRRILSGSD